MSAVERYYGKVINGKLIFNGSSLQRFTLALQRMEGDEFEIEIRRRTSNVSEDQHGYYRAGIIRTALSSEQFGGWTEDELHDFLADRFLSYVFHKNRNGNVTEVRGVRSTAHLNRREMAQYIEKCVAWLTNEGIKVGSPEEYHLKQYKTR